MKYIVYKTTNLVNNYIYIGVHKTNTPYEFDGYLGCGVIINNPSTYKYSKTCFQIAVNQYGVKNFRRETLAVFDTEEDAYILEQLLVNEEFLSRSDTYNMILGGQGGNSYTNKCYQYDLNGNYVKEYSSYRDACRAVNKSYSAIYNAITFKTKCGDYYWNTDKVDKLDLSNYTLTPESVKIYRYLVDGGKFDKSFDSASQAAKDSNLTLIQVLRSARLCYRAGEYQFLYIKGESYDSAKKQYINNRPVYKYSSSGEFIESYKTQHEAELNNKESNITNSIKNKKPCKNNFLWGLEKLPFYNQPKQTQKKRIGKYTLEGELIETFDSVKECVQKVGIPSSYIRIGKKYKNYIYKNI